MNDLVYTYELQITKIVDTYSRNDLLFNKVLVNKDYFAD